MSFFSAFKYTTDWEYVSSEDTTGSFFASVSTGRVWLKNVSTEETMTLKYRCLSISWSKGLPYGISQSSFKDPSVGDGPVVSNRHFDSFCFPCRGYIFSLGGTLGVFQPADPNDPDPNNWTNGGALNIFIFGVWPVFAALRCRGSFRGTTPGGGLGGGLAVFEEE